MLQAVKPKPPSIVVLGALLLIGGFALGLGARAFSEIRQIYRVEDLAFSESPQTFRRWVLEAQREGQSDEALTAAVAERLRIMRIDKRRALVHELMSDDFADSLSSDGKNRRRIFGILLNGVLAAVSSSPFEGDLWLAAARLRRRYSGFDEKAEPYLEASFRYTPREIYLVIDRVLFAAQLAIVLSPGVRDMARRDQDYLDRFNSHGFANIREAQVHMRGLDFSAE